jgi:hypothetical protein
MAFDYCEWSHAILQDFGLESEVITVAEGICALRHNGNRTIPSARKIVEAIMTEFDLSTLVTVDMREWAAKRTLQQLLDRGYLIVAKHGKGTFVSSENAERENAKRSIKNRPPNTDKEGGGLNYIGGYRI